MSDPLPTPQPGSAARARAFLVKDPDFRRVWAVGGLSEGMRWLEMLAIGVFVFDLTGSAWQVALVAFVRMLPMALLGAISGALAERLDRKSLLVGGLATMSVTSAVLGLLVVTEAIALWHIALGGFISGIYMSMEFPVRRTVLGDIAGPERLGAAMGLDSATRHAMRMLGPATGGLLLQLIGLHGAYFLSALVFAGLTLLLLPLRYREDREGVAEWAMLPMILDGLAYIRSSPLVVGTLTVAVVLNLFGFPYAAMVPVIGRAELGLSAFPIGVLQTTEALGAFSGALAAAFLARQRDFARIYFVGAAMFIAGILAFALAGSYGISLAVLLAAGVGLAGFSSMQATLILVAVPPALRGRVMGIMSMCIGMGPIGILHVGALADWLGASAALAVMATEGLVAMLLAGLLWPQLLRRV